MHVLITARFGNQVSFSVKALIVERVMPSPASFSREVVIMAIWSNEHTYSFSSVIYNVLMFK